MSLDQTGPLVTPGTIERAVKAHLTTPDGETGGTWLAEGIAFAEREEGYQPGEIAHPQAIVTSSEYEKMPTDLLPCLVIYSPGLAAAPVKRGDGSYEAAFSVGLMPIVSSLDEENTRDLLNAYIGACMWSMLVKPSLGGFAAETAWRDLRTDELPHEVTRTLQAARVMFAVTVENVVKRAPGIGRPRATPEPAPPAWPTATDVDFDVELVPITEEVNA